MRNPLSPEDAAHKNEKEDPSPKKKGQLKTAIAVSVGTCLMLGIIGFEISRETWKNKSDQAPLPPYIRNPSLSGSGNSNLYNMSLEEMVKLQNENLNQQERIVTLRNELWEAQDQLQELKKQLFARDNSADQSRTALLKAKLTEKTDESNHLKTKLAKIQSELAASDKRIANLDEAVASLNEMLALHKGSKVQAEEKYFSHLAHLENAFPSQSLSADQTPGLDDNHKAKSIINAIAAKQHDLLIKSLEALEQQLTLENELKGFKLQANNYQTHQERLHNAFNSLGIEGNNLEEQFHNFHALAEEQNNLYKDPIMEEIRRAGSLEELKSELASASAKHSMMDQIEHDHKAAIEELSQKIASYEQQLQDLPKTYSQSITDLESQHAQIIADLNARHATKLEEKINELKLAHQNELDAEINKLEDAYYSELEDQVKHQNFKNSTDLDAEIKRIQNIHATQLEEQINQLKTAHAVEVDNLFKQLQDIRTVNDGNVATQQKIQKSLDFIGVEGRDIEEQIRNFDKLVVKHNELYADPIMQEARQLGSLAALKAEVDLAASRHATDKQEMATLNKQIEELTQNIQTLVEQSSKLKQEHALELEKIYAEMQNLESENGQHHAYQQHIRKTLETIGVQGGDLADQIKAFGDLVAENSELSHDPVIMEGRNIGSLKAIKAELEMGAEKRVADMQEIATLQTEIRSLNENIFYLEDQIQKLKQEKDTHFDIASKETSQLQKELASEQSAHKLTQEELKLVQNNLKHVSDQYQLTAEEIENAQEELNALLSERDSLVLRAEHLAQQHIDHKKISETQIIELQENLAAAHKAGVEAQDLLAMERINQAMQAAEFFAESERQLNQKIDLIAQERDGVQSKLKDALEKHQQIEQQYLELTNTVAKLEEQLRKETEHSQKFNEQFEMLAQEKNETQQKLKEAIDKHLQFEQQQQEISNTVAKLEEQLRKETENAKAFNDKFGTLAQEKSDTEQKLKDAIEKHLQFEQQQLENANTVAKLEDQLRKETERAQAFNEKIGILAQEKTDAHLKLKDTLDKHQQFEQQQHDLSTAITNLEDKLRMETERSQSLSEQLKYELKLANAKVEDLETQLAKERQEATQKNADHDLVTARILDLEAKLEDAKTTTSNLQHEVELHQANASLANREYTANNDKMIKQLQNEQANSQNLHAQLTHIMQEHGQTKELNQSYSEQLVALQSERQQLYGDLNHQIQSLTQKLESDQAKLNAYVKEVETLNKLLVEEKNVSAKATKGLEETSTMSAAALEEMQNALLKQEEDWRKHLAELKNLLDEEKQNNTKLTNQLQALLDKDEHNKQELNTFLEQLKEHKNEQEALKHAHQTEMDALNATMVSAEAQTKKIIAEKLQLKEQEFHAKEAEWGVSNQNLLNLIYEENQRHENLLVEVQNLQSERDHLVNQVEHTKQQLDAQLEEHIATNEALKGHIEGLESLLDREKQINVELDQKLTDLVKKEQQNNAQLSSYQEDLKRHKEEQNKTRISLESEINRLHSVIGEETNQTHSQLMNSIQELETSLEKKEKEWADQNKDLEKQITEEKSWQKELVAEIERLNYENRIEKLRYNKLKKQHDTLQGANAK